MKVIFLDIDGVLGTNESYERLGGGDKVPFHREAVRNLNRLVEATGAKVVISSAWPTDTAEDLRDLFAEQGACCDIIGTTPVIADGNWFRWKEIMEWLRETDIQVESFVIIDDDCTQIGQHFPDRFVETTMEEGLNKAARPRVTRILNRRS